MKSYYKVKRKLKSLFLKPEVVPSYESKRKIISHYREKFQTKVMVETGTFLGDTVDYFKGSFDRVISIELSEQLAAKAKLRFEKDRNVEIITGDSAKILPEIIKNETGAILFWLDGHYSSEFYVGDELVKTARSKKDTPIEEELQAILYTKISHVILIDDARLFDGISDYPSINELRKIIRKSGKNYTLNVQEDIIRITPISE